MSDILARLMRWMETSDIDDAGAVLCDAITEIAGLRARLHEHRIAAQRLAELSDARQRGETGQPVLSDAEREVARLREAIRRLADRDATLSVCDGSVTVTMDATFTDAERDDIACAASRLESEANGPRDLQVAATLRGLLDRRLK